MHNKFLLLLLTLPFIVEGATCFTSTLSIGNHDVRARKMIEEGAIRYFLEGTHPETGIVLDRMPAFEGKKTKMGSIAATGFGLAVLSDAAVRGKISQAAVERLALKSLKFVSKISDHKGWLSHFMDWETGQSAPGSEISTIDTALFIAGALVAGENLRSQPEIKQLAETLYRRLDFKDMMTNGGANSEKKTLSMGWDPLQRNYLSANWDTYSEHMILQFLGLGHPEAEKRLPKEAWDAWERQTITLPDGKKLMGADLPLFAHQYPWMFLNPKLFKIGDIDPFKNSRLATLRDKELSAKSPLLEPFGLWGLSASDSAPPEGYRAYRHGDGGKDPGDNIGTVCPGCVAGSYVFAPEEVTPYLDGLAIGRYAKQIVGKYGFVDAFNPSRYWTGSDSLGITVGPAYMSSKNLEDGAFWKAFSQTDAFKNALKAIH